MSRSRRRVGDKVSESFTDPISIYWASPMYKTLTRYWVYSDQQTVMLSVLVEVIF